ncbi:vacuolar ATPase assembly integral membrane protein vma21 [Coemansia sp. RSA 1365]|nr:vacuolar ATPase assembly integral membrane protein vma21 [Coemansia sp. RSA 1365]
MAPLKTRTEPKANNTVKDSPNTTRRQRKRVDINTENNAAQPVKHAEAESAPQIPGNVVGKLVAFSLLLLIMPILAYFLSLKLVFAGSTTPSAITAAVTANVVLAGYVYVAWVEDVDEGSENVQKRKLE